MAETQSDSGSPPLGSPADKKTEDRWWKFGGVKDRTTRPVISHEEVFALLEYATNNGINKSAIEALSKEIHKPEPDPSTVAAMYAGLVEETKPINGGTLIDSRESGLARLFGISVATTAFFVLAIGNAIVDNWVADMVEPEEGLFWLDLKVYIWDYLTPFFWGSLGACVYLMKAVQDAARDNLYEHHYMEGWGTRVLIGGILAAIVLIIFDPSTLSTDSLPLSSAAIAFLVGLGVKPVYGALEKTIETLSNKLNLQSIRRVPAPDPPDKKVQSRNGDDSA